MFGLCDDRVNRYELIKLIEKWKGCQDSADFIAELCKLIDYKPRQWGATERIKQDAD